MNRRARRAGSKLHTLSVGTPRPNDIVAADLFDQANRCHQQGRSGEAESLCNRILAGAPDHVPALNLFGLILQASGRHRRAIKALTKAVAADPLNAACHYNLASSYQALDQCDQAMLHFKTAITLRQRRSNTERLILQNAAIVSCIDRIEAQYPLPVNSAQLFPAATFAAIADDLFLRSALAIVPIRGVALERFLTALRATLLGMAHSALYQNRAFEPNLTILLISLAQQCFINEYVFVQQDDELGKATALRELLEQKSNAAEAIPPLLPAAVAAYFPLYALPVARALANRDWPQNLAELVRQQLQEPLQEIDDRTSIPTLTAVNDAVSIRVMQQYEDNPYPRWTLAPIAGVTGDGADRAGGNDGAPGDILVAGCGSGRHALDVAQRFPNGHVLAVDISLASLAYARRKTREAGCGNIEYGRADILELPVLGRSFDRIEAVGVLHHLADPESGWRLLLSMLRPHGTMRIGLYSDIARQAVVAVRAMIAERGYRPTAESIRECRQQILGEYEKRGWIRLVESGDFYTMSGCRDFLFNVMEHRFTIPRIGRFLEAEALSFLGFDIDPLVIENFLQQYPAADALLDLGKWQAFEQQNPATFRHMYVFTVRKN